MAISRPLHEPMRVLVEHVECGIQPHDAKVDRDLACAGRELERLHGCRSQGLRRSAGHRPGLRSFAVAGVAPTNARFRNTCAPGTSLTMRSDALLALPAVPGPPVPRRPGGRAVRFGVASTTSVPPRQRSLGASPQPLLAPRIAKRFDRRW